MATEYENLKDLPNFGDLFNRELGGVPVPPDLFATLMQMWPDLYEGADGGTRVRDQDAEPRLEALFELYGFPLKVKDNSIAVLGHAFDVCAALAMHVMRRLRYPNTFRRVNDDWPEDWLAYIEAVAVQDKKAARLFAQKLQPLAPECEFPPRATVDSPKKTPL